MIKFFRNIRRLTINNGNFKKYLLYAIGEIVLVVVGILIALSINNLNNKNSDRKSEVKIYENLKNQIHDDRLVLEGVVDYNNTYIEQFDYALKIIAANDRSKIDTLQKIAINLFRYSDYNKSSNVYQMLVNSGELKLMQNTEIINRLQRLEETYIYMNRLEDNHFKVMMRFVGPGIMDNINFATGDVERPDELYTLSMQNLYIGFMDIMNEKDVAYKRAFGDIDALTALIDEELQQ